MLRITFPYLLLISLTGFAGAILNSYDRFVVPRFYTRVTQFILNWFLPYLLRRFFFTAGLRLSLGGCCLQVFYSGYSNYHFWLKLIACLNPNGTLSMPALKRF